MKFIRSHLKKRILVQNRGGREDQTGGILQYFEDLSRAPNKEFGPKNFFEIASRFFFTTLILLGLCGAFIPGNAHSKDIRWQSYADGMARSKSENKKMFVHFYADWCGTCKVMEKKTFRDPGVIAALNRNYVPVKINVDKSKKIAQIFKIELIPDTWFITGNNEIIGHRPGYISPQQLKSLLKMFLEDDL